MASTPGWSVDFEVDGEGASAGFLEGEGQQGGPRGDLQFGVVFCVVAVAAVQLIGELSECVGHDDCGGADESAGELHGVIGVRGESQPVGVHVVIGVIAAIRVEFGGELGDQRGPRVEGEAVGGGQQVALRGGQISAVAGVRDPAQRLAVRERDPPGDDRGVELGRTSRTASRRSSSREPDSVVWWRRW